MIFQIGFRNGGYFLVSFRTSFVLKFRKDILILLNMEVIWSRLLVQEFYFSFQNFKFLGSSIGILFSFKWFLFLFLCIWLGNSKSNGGKTFLLQILNSFLLFAIGFQGKILLQLILLQRIHLQFPLMLFFYPELFFLLIRSSSNISNF